MTQTFTDADSTGEIPRDPDPLRHTEVIDIGALHAAAPTEVIDAPAGWSPIRHQIDENAVIGIPRTATMGMASDGLDLLGYDPGPYPPVPPPLPPAPDKTLVMTDPAPPQPLPNPGPPPRPACAGHESAEHPLVRRSVPYVMPAGHRRRRTYRSRHLRRYVWMRNVGWLLTGFSVTTLITLAVIR